MLIKIMISKQTITFNKAKPKLNIQLMIQQYLQNK